MGTSPYLRTVATLVVIIRMEYTVRDPHAVLKELENCLTKKLHMFGVKIVTTEKKVFFYREPHTF